MAGYERQDDGATDTQQNRYLTFAVENESYGIEIRCVREIVGIQEINSIPECPDYIKGIINLRGNIIPIVDMRLRLLKEPVDYNDRTCIIVIEIGGTMAGLIVDSVAEVITIGEADISEPPQFNNKNKYRYIKGIGKSGSAINLILDCKKLMLNEISDDFDAIGMPADEQPVLESANMSY